MEVFLLRIINYVFKNSKIICLELLILKNEGENMQILSLKLNEYQNINKSNLKRNSKKQTLTTSYPMTQSQIYFNPAYCVSFSGACVDLSKAMKTLKATEILKEDIRLPKRVEDLANSVIRKGNTQNLTLIDVHKQAYFDIMYAKSLEEVRARFPEFSKVLSVVELEQKPQNGSFLREILDGKNEYFNSKSKKIYSFSFILKKI